MDTMARQAQAQAAKGTLVHPATAIRAAKTGAPAVAEVHERNESAVVFRAKRYKVGGADRPAPRREEGPEMAARKRELIEPHPGDKRYIRRDEEGRFTTDQVDVGRSLRQDVKQPAKQVVPAGQGDKGDQKRR